MWWLHDLQGLKGLHIHRGHATQGRITTSTLEILKVNVMASSKDRLTEKDEEEEDIPTLRLTIEKGKGRGAK